MASKKQGFFRRPGSKVRKHAIQRLRQYVGNRRGYSDAIGRKILLALQRAGRRAGMLNFPITPDNIEEGGGSSDLFFKHKIKKNLYVVFDANWSITNVLQEEDKKR